MLTKILKNHQAVHLHYTELYESIRLSKASKTLLSLNHATASHLSSWAPTLVWLLIRIYKIQNRLKWLPELESNHSAFRWPIKIETRLSPYEWKRRFCDIQEKDRLIPVKGVKSSKGNDPNRSCRIQTPLSENKWYWGKTSELLNFPALWENWVHVRGLLCRQDRKQRRE